MGQVTIYLDDETERLMVAEAKRRHLSKSKWIAGVIREAVEDTWPSSVTSLEGAWSDFCQIEDLREEQPKDVDRGAL